MSVRAVLLAAGKGTRMKSGRPKVLHELCGRPMLWHAMRALDDVGVTDSVIVTNPELDAVLAETNGVRTVVQEPQRGTGHAVQIALDALEPGDGTILVTYGDMPLVDGALLQRVLEAQRGDVALALVSARVPLPSSFGRVVRRGDDVVAIVEARDCTLEQLQIDETNAGIYAFDERALREVIGELDDDNAQGELYLTDAVEHLVARGRRVVSVVCQDPASVLGVNDRVDLARARAAMNARLCEAHMRAGVTIVDPATTYLEPGLEIAPDTTILPNTMLGGGTRIGTGCRIGPNTVIVDCAIGDGVTIGPFAHLRGGAILADDVRIGNFVEVKGSELAAGVKAMHLAYLGDSSVGTRTNIGAGTITCNYDGVRKNRTTIGEDVFIGSNSSLVAPVTIGDRAATGAGTVVIRDVPEDGRVVGNPARPLPAKVRESV